MLSADRMLGGPGDIMKRQLDVASLLDLAEKRHIKQSLPEEGGSGIVQVYRQVKEGCG